MNQLSGIDIQSSVPTRYDGDLSSEVGYEIVRIIAHCWILRRGGEKGSAGLYLAYVTYCAVPFILQ